MCRAQSQFVYPYLRHVSWRERTTRSLQATRRGNDDTTRSAGVGSASTTAILPVRVRHAAMTDVQFIVDMAGVPVNTVPYVVGCDYPPQGGCTGPLLGPTGVPMLSMGAPRPPHHDPVAARRHHELPAPISHNCCSCCRWHSLECDRIPP